MSQDAMTAFLALQAFAVLFIAFHDWIPLGRLNNVKGVQSADSKFRLVLVTILSTLPFAAALAGSVHFLGKPYPDWLVWTLWLSYGGALYGLLRAWWVPYLFLDEPKRAVRYQAMFGGTLAFLPEHNGIRPNLLHVTLHAAVIAIVVLMARSTF